MAINPLPPGGQSGYDYESGYVHYEQHLALTILILTLATLIVFGTLFGNILTIVAVVKEDSLRNVGNSFIVSLAVADLLLAIVVMPFDIVEYVIGHLPAGTVGCFFYANNNLLFCAASIFNITCISIDRYTAITDPLHYATRMTPKVAGTMISCTWIISVLLAYIPLLINWFSTIPFMHVINDACYFDLVHIAVPVVLMFSICMPCLMMLVAYGMIFKVARKQARQIQALAQVAQNLNNVEKGTAQKSCKAAKTLGLITGVFLLCWLPFSILMLTAFVFPETAALIPTIVWELISWMGYFNSMCNPAIYALCNQSFRKAFRKILFRR